MRGQWMVEVHHTTGGYYLPCTSLEDARNACWQESREPSTVRAAVCWLTECPCDGVDSCDEHDTCPTPLTWGDVTPWLLAHLEHIVEVRWSYCERTRRQREAWARQRALSPVSLPYWSEIPSETWTHVAHGHGECASERSGQ